MVSFNNPSKSLNSYITKTIQVPVLYQQSIFCGLLARNSVLANIFENKNPTIGKRHFEAHIDMLIALHGFHRRLEMYAGGFSYMCLLSTWVVCRVKTQLCKTLHHRQTSCSRGKLSPREGDICLTPGSMLYNTSPDKTASKHHQPILRI